MDIKIKPGKIMPMRDLSYIAISTAILAICSWLKLPFPIPVTLQSFGVFVSMGLLGGKRAFFTVALYLLIGCIGLPVFSGFAGGFGYLLGSTGGYLFGFLLPPLLMWFCEIFLRESKQIFIPCAFIGLVGCYATGTIWYAVFYAKHSATNIFNLCVTPFILPDLLKLLAAHHICSRLNKQIKL